MKEGRFVNIADRYIGTGDLLFFVVMAFAFSLGNFIMIFTGALLFSLIAYGVFMLLKPNANKHIPLAGLMAFPMIAIQIGLLLFDSQSLHHTQILNWVL